MSKKTKKARKKAERALNLRITELSRDASASQVKDLAEAHTKMRHGQGGSWQYDYAKTSDRPIGFGRDQ